MQVAISRRKDIFIWPWYPQSSDCWQHSPHQHTAKVVSLHCHKKSWLQRGTPACQEVYTCGTRRRQSKITTIVAHKWACLGQKVTSTDDVHLIVILIVAMETITPCKMRIGVGLMISWNQKIQMILSLNARSRQLYVSFDPINSSIASLKSDGIICNDDNFFS